MKKIKVLALLTVLAMIFTAGACGAPAPASTPAPAPATQAIATQAPEATKAAEPAATASQDKHYTFGFTEWIACDFFDSVYEGLSSQIKAGDKVIHSEGQANANYQLGVIENFVAQKVDVVFYNPVDTQASQVAVDMMKKAGILIINFDSQVANLDDVASFVGTDNYKAGFLAGEAMKKDFPNGGEIAVIDYPANMAAVDRENGFLEAIKGSNLKVVQTLDGKGLTEDSTRQMEDVLQAHPNLIAMFGINDDSGLGAYAAIKSANLDVKVYSVNGSPAAKEKVAEGGIFAVTVAQSTINMGKESALVAYKILNGETAAHDNLIAPIVINKDNVGQYGTTGWQ